jgi:putative ABC transport system permease protein
VKLWKRIRYALNREAFDRDLREEMRVHREMAEEKLGQLGTPKEEAHYQAMRAFGNASLAHEASRAEWTLSFATLVQDIGFAIRILRKSAGFTAVAILTLGLGIGANTAIFSVVDAVLLRGLPYRDPGRLVWATNFIPRNGQTLVFPDEYAAWRSQNHVFESIAAYSPSAEHTLTGEASPQRLRGGKVTASFLNVLGVNPQLGRNFLAEEEDRPGGPKAVLLTDALWRSSFKSDPSVVGRVVALDNVTYTVVGVLPSNFEFLDNNPVDVLIPFQLADSSLQNSNGRVMVLIESLLVVARLLPDATLRQATNELNVINKRVQNTLPGDFGGLADAQPQVLSLHDHEVGNVQPALLILLGAVGFVLLIACTNVANLQIVRAAAREKEVAVRRALGAGRWHLTRLVMAESSVVALSGGTAGLALAVWLIQLIRHFSPQNVPHSQGAHLDVRVLVFTLALSLLTGLLFGLAPLLTAFGVSLTDTLKESGSQGGAGKRTRHAQSALMVAEIAFSIILLIGAGLLIKTFLHLTAVQPGFDPDGVLTAQVALPLDQYRSLERQRSFFEQLVQRLAALPGVSAAAVANSLPLRGSAMISSIEIEGRPSDEIRRVSINTVTPGYFASLRVPLLDGRFLSDHDIEGAPLSVVVNQTFVRHFFAGENPIGKQFSTGMAPGTGPAFGPPGEPPPGGTPRWTIVGVIGDTKQHGLASETMPEMTTTASQWPQSRMTVVLRTSVEPSMLASAVRKELAELDRNLPLFGVQTMDEVLSAEVASQRFNAAAVAGFAAVAVLLAAVGLYAVVAYAVRRRTHEIGVRMALGAEPQNVLFMVIKQALEVTLIGVGLGVAASFGLMRLIRRMLFGVNPSDPVTFALVTGVVICVAIAACWIPARRAMRVDPIIALRYE